MKGYVCGTCGYISIDGTVPDKCPVCAASKTSFEQKDIIKTAEAEGPKEKHVPVIEVVKKCSLVGEGCTDVHVKIGDTLHPMEAEHYINFIELFRNNESIEKKELKPGDKPEAVFENVVLGNLKVQANCNQHGLWESISR